MASEVTSSIEVEINLMDLLSLAGIELPQTPTTGSTQELPKKIKLEKLTRRFPLDTVFTICHRKFR